MSNTVRFVPGQNAPMSPHLQVWKFTVTMAASITHRITGVGNAIGMLLMVSWVGSAAISDEAFGAVSSFLASGFGRFLLFGFTLSFTFHLANGIRYLFWDSGKGFEKSTGRMTSWLAYAAAPILTVVIFWAAYQFGGTN